MNLNWLTTIENLSEILKIPFFDVYELEIITFFNMMSYLNHKNNQLKKQYGN